MASSSRSEVERSCSPDLHKSADCPVCFRVFENPKSLVCGHSFCERCCIQLQGGGRIIMCPTCRSRTMVSQNGLPTNYSLQEIVSVMVSKESGVFPCGTCAKKFDKSEIWICHGCSAAMLCAVCSLKQHKGHHLQEMSDLLAHRQKEINQWKAKVAPKIIDVEREDKEISTTSVQLRARVYQINNLLSTSVNWAQKLRQDLKKEYQEFKTELTSFTDQESIVPASIESVICGVGDEIAVHEKKVDAFSQKQKDGLANQKALLEMLTDFEARVRAKLGMEADNGMNKRKRVKPLRLNLRVGAAGGSPNLRSPQGVIQLDSDDERRTDGRTRVTARQRQSTPDRTETPPLPGPSRAIGRNNHQRRTFFPYGRGSRNVSQSPEPSRSRFSASYAFREPSSGPDSDVSLSPAERTRHRSDTPVPDGDESPYPMRMEEVSPVHLLQPASPSPNRSPTASPARLASQSPQSPLYFRWSSSGSSDEGGPTPAQRSRWNIGRNEQEQDW